MNKEKDNLLKSIESLNDSINGCSSGCFGIIVILLLIIIVALLI